MEQLTDRPIEEGRPAGRVIMEIAEKYQDSPNVVNAKEDAKIYATARMRIAAATGSDPDAYRWAYALHFAETGEEGGWTMMKKEIEDDGDTLMSKGDFENMGKALKNLSESIIPYLL